MSNEFKFSLFHLHNYEPEKDEEGQERKRERRKRMKSALKRLRHFAPLEAFFAYCIRSSSSSIIDLLLLYSCSSILLSDRLHFEKKEKVSVYRIVYSQSAGSSSR